MDNAECKRVNKIARAHVKSSKFAQNVYVLFIIWLLGYILIVQFLFLVIILILNTI